MKHMRIILTVLIVLLLSGCNTGTVSNSTNNDQVTYQQIKEAYDKETPVQGSFFIFDENNEYKFSENEANDSIAPVGLFSINGEFDKQWDNNGIQSFSAASQNVDISYRYVETLLSAAEEDWHLISDSAKTVDQISLDSKIEKGVIILQTSKDGKIWYTEKVASNVFESIPTEGGVFYHPTSVQLSNGCYYRLIVAYEAERKVGENNILFVSLDETEKKRQAEVYYFYLISNEHVDETATKINRFELGEKYRVKTADGYVGKQEIKANDPHYGWDIGTFFVSGFTERIVDESSEITDVVFLKNVGDKVTLGFTLNYDINALNGKSNLSIDSETGASDQEFQTIPTDFRKGALIVRYRDYTNKKTDPQIYTNYLEASVSPGADTTIQLCEEGDYEVVLDYKIRNDRLIDEYAWYRIRFNFKVRNSNCMVFPFDVTTNSELMNSSFTENGFYLDLANSRYLAINIKKSVLTEGADGLTQDTRFNRSAKDGEQFTDEGVYTITVQNKYTKQETVKVIYVGTDSIVKAHVVTGISIPKIRTMVSQGAIINKDGTIIENTEETPQPINTSKEEETTPDTTDSASESHINETKETEPTNSSKTGISSYDPLTVIIVVVVLLFVLRWILTRKRNRRN